MLCRSVLPLKEPQIIINIFRNRFNLSFLSLETRFTIFNQFVTTRYLCAGETKNFDPGWKLTRGQFSTLKIETKSVKKKTLVRCIITCIVESWSGNRFKIQQQIFTLKLIDIFNFDSFHQQLRYFHNFSLDLHMI